MANYLKGIGDVVLRVNEILPGFDARINNFLCGHTAGIIKNEYNEFAATTIDRGVIIKSGMLQSYGYFACCDTETQINFLMPSTTNYVHIYAEIDLSIVPNKFEIKASPMSNSASWTPRTDNLKTIPNGKYQFHLYQVTLTATTIVLADKRTYIYKPSDAVTAENYTASGGIASKFSSVESSINTRMPKMTLVLSNKSFTINTNGVGSQTYSLNSGTTIQSGDLILVNARLTNFGTHRTMCGIIRMATSVRGWITHAFGGTGMPYHTIDTVGLSIELGANTSQIKCGGDCRTRIRGDEYDADGHKITLADAAYTIDSIYKINL
jgi:hypothetical protein